MKKQFQSFYKRLSQRILLVCLLTIVMLGLHVITFVVAGLVQMMKIYFYSELKASSETIAKQLDAKTNQDAFYQYMKQIDVDINKAPFLRNSDEHGKKWAYSVVVDSTGTYLYHPDKQRIGKQNLFDDLQEPAWKNFTGKTSTVIVDYEMITIDDTYADIFYIRRPGTSWTNAIVVPIEALMSTTNITAFILLTFIILGMLATYWISRRSIRRATLPLQQLTESADEVAKGNFKAPLPQLKYNDEISQLRDSFGNMQHSLTQYIEQLKTTTAQKAAIENELNIARDIQLSVVPTQFPELKDSIIYGSMTPAKAVGGNLYDFFVRDKELIFCIGDVSGKGVPAALFMMMTRSLFRAYAADGDTPDRIVTRMNRVLSENNDSYMFVTLIVGIFDMESGELRYCNAGHEPPIIINQEAHFLELDSTFPVGPIADATYQTHAVVLEPQSSILFYTDGLTEAMNAEEEELGAERVFDELNQIIHNAQASPKLLIERMTQAVHNFAGDTEQSDDLTLLCIRRESL